MRMIENVEFVMHGIENVEYFLGKKITYSAHCMKQRCATNACNACIQWASHDDH